MLYTTSKKNSKNILGNMLKNISGFRVLSSETNTFKAKDTKKRRKCLQRYCESRTKTHIPKQQGRHGPTSCPRQIQSLSCLNALKNGDSITSVGFSVWLSSQCTFFSSHWLGISCFSMLSWLPLSHCRAPWILSCFGTDLSHSLLLELFQEALKTLHYTVGL